MIQYSSINDAWGNKEMYKKNTINNIDGFSNKQLINKSIDIPKQIETFIQPKSQEVEPVIPQQVVLPQQKVETFSQQQVLLPQKVETFSQQQVLLPQKVETFVPQQPILHQYQHQHQEHFNNVQPITAMRTSCNFAEHLRNCEHCRNSLSEYFDNDNSISTINIFGLKIKITKDVLKIIFVIIIVLIFIIILSTINVSLKDSRTHMKYYMVPQVSNIPMNNIPFYH